MAYPFALRGCRLAAPIVTVSMAAAIDLRLVRLGGWGAWGRSRSCASKDSVVATSSSLRAFPARPGALLA